MTGIATGFYKLDKITSGLKPHELIIIAARPGMGKTAYALNLAIKTLLNPNCHVITSDFEHNSVIRPLEALKEKKKISYGIFSTEGTSYVSICSST